MKKLHILILGILLVITVSFVANVIIAESESMQKDYHRSKWDPVHFNTAINKTTDKQCLSCHQEILDSKPRDESPAGVKKLEVLAWYQTLDTYEGEQESFHRRHLVTPFAKKVMDMKCITCHQSNDPREETIGSSADGPINPVHRKAVDPEICLMCHGQFPWKLMTGLPGPWEETGKIFNNDCMICHSAIRTNRHQVNFLKPEAIERAGASNGDVCFGCHGGRAWYRISHPYPRHDWPGMPEDLPDWAKDRPTESLLRYLTGLKDVTNTKTDSE